MVTSIDMFASIDVSIDMFASIDVSMDVHIYRQVVLTPG